MTGELSVLPIDGGTLGAVAFGLQGQRALLTIDAASVDVNTIKVISLDGGDIATAPSSVGSNVYAIVTMNAAEAAGREWRVLQVGAVKLTRVRMTDPRFWALLIIDVADAAVSDYRNYQAEGGIITVVATTVLGYNALLTLSKDSSTPANIRVFQMPSGTVSRQEMTTPGFFALLFGGGSAPPVIPVNTVAPIISGTQSVGSTITITPGTWTGSPTLVRHLFSGITDRGVVTTSYVVASGDAGTTLTVVETATNAAGSAQATSNALLMIPATVTVIAPTDASTTPSQTPTITSSAVPAGATGIDFDAATDSGFVTIVQSTTNDADGSWVPGSLANFTTHYLRARSRNAAGQSAWSATVSFMPKFLLLGVAWATVDAAPLANPYAGEVGNVLNVDTNSIIGAPSGLLAVNGTPVASDRVVASDGSAVALSYARTVGRAFRVLSQLRTAAINGALKFGFDVSATVNSIQYGWDWNSTTVLRVKEGVSVIRTITMSASGVSAAAIMRTTGGKIITKDGAGTPTLQWVYPSNNAALFAKMILSAVAMNITTDDWDVFDYAPLASDFIDTSVHTTPGASGNTFTAQADGIHHLAFTLGAGSANLVAVELRYRITDANNYYTAYIKRNAGNTAWDLLVDKVVAGTPTNLKTTTGVGTPTRIIVWTSGSAYEHYTDTGSASTQRDTGTDATYTTQALIGAAWDASTTIGSLDSWPLTNSLYANLFT